MLWYAYGWMHAHSFLDHYCKQPHNVFLSNIAVGLQRWNGRSRFYTPPLTLPLMEKSSSAVRYVFVYTKNMMEEFSMWATKKNQTVGWVI